MADVKIERVAYHRNGSEGEGFHVVTFRNAEDPEAGRMVATVFERAGHVAILSLDHLAQNRLTMREGNAWRYEAFEPALREAVESYQAYADKHPGSAHAHGWTPELEAI